MISISRRRFLTLSGGLLVTGCTAGRQSWPDGAVGSGIPPTSLGPTTTTTVPPVSTDAVTVTTVATPAELVPGDRVLVMVELAGGNDAINTLAPDIGRYRDVRPTLALPDSELLRDPALPGHALHPALGPLVPELDAGRLAVVAGVGFPDPDRSHFVSTDRWLRADRMDEELGWLGRWVDGLPDDLPALGATALGGRGRMLLGAGGAGTVIDAADAFSFPVELDNSTVRQLAAPGDDDALTAAAKQAFAAAVGAVEEFDSVADAVRGRAAGDDGFVALDGAFSTGLAVAAELIIGDVGTRVVTVSGNGFDTHGEQLDLQADLLADLAAGLSGFWQTLDAAGSSDRVLLVTHSEFGRRVAENGSGGTDHGAAGLSLVMGDAVIGGLHGEIDLGDVVNGDLRAQFDPRTMYTAALDWLGGDVERVLGARYDEFDLLRTV